jgi:hypothetical protein
MVAVLAVRVLQDFLRDSVFVLHLYRLAADLLVRFQQGLYMMVEISLRLQVWLLTRLALPLTALQPLQRLQQTLPFVLCVCAHTNHLLGFIKDF